MTVFLPVCVHFLIIQTRVSHHAAGDVQGEDDADGHKEDEDDDEEHGQDVLRGKTLDLGGDEDRDVVGNAFNDLPQLFGIFEEPEKIVGGSFDPSSEFYPFLYPILVHVKRSFLRSVLLVNHLNIG